LPKIRDAGWEQQKIYCLYGDIADAVRRGEEFFRQLCENIPKALQERDAGI
jgi:hypothetical protein